MRQELVTQYMRQDLTDQALGAVSRSRLDLILDHPFFGSLALRLKPVADPNCELMWTDGIRLGVNPEAFLGLPLRQRLGVIAHEVLHCTNGHPWRQDERDGETWASACDQAINPILLDAGLELPGTPKMPSSANAGQSAEAIYADLIRDKQPDGSQGQGDGDGDGEGQGDGEGEGISSGNGKKNFKDPGAIRKPSGNSGSGSSANGDGQNSQSQVPSSVNNEELENMWKVATIQAAMMAKSRGELPGCLSGIIEQVKKPRINWRSELRRFMQDNARNDYAWSRPNTRFIARGIYMPALRSEEMGPVVVVADTSGSVSGDELAGFMAETESVIEECKPEYTLLIQADAQVAHVARYERGDLFKVPEVHGRGGTDFRPAFEYLKQQGIEPACLIYLTDLAGVFPEAPDYPVLWVSTTEGQAEFGETITLDIHS